MDMIPFRTALAVALAALCAAAAAPAVRADDSAARVGTEARFAGKGEAPAGGTARLEVTLTIQPGWHIYGPGDAYEEQVTTLSATGGLEGLTFGPFTPTTAPKSVASEVDPKPRMEFEGTVTWWSEVAIAPGTPGGERTVSGSASVYACDAGSCLPPGKAAWSARLVVTAAAAPAPIPELPAVARVVKVRPAAMGDRRRIAVTLEIADGWHVYGPGDSMNLATVVRVVKAPAGVRFGAFTPDRAPLPHAEEGLDAPRMEFHGAVTYSADYEAPAAVADPFPVEGEVVVNACDPSMCYPEGAIPFAVSLPRPPAGGRPVAAAAPPAVPVGGPAPAPGPAADAGEGGISLSFLLAAVAAGLLTILTPCVFPMIPLTVSLLTKSAEKEPGRVVPNAFAYGAGMFFSLAGIGLFLTVALHQAPTALTQTSWFNLAIFAFLMYLALSLFGAYDIQLPAFLTNWSQGKAGTGGGAGLFFMGMTLAFTSFACAAPFAGVLLVRAQKDLVNGFVGMCAYAGAFSGPFFLLALFPGVMRKLPKSGGWLNAVKVVMGFVEVAAAFKFLRAADLYLQWGVFSYELVLAVWVACAIGAALYLLGFIVLPHDTKVEGIGVARLLWAVGFLSSALFLLPGMFGRDIPAYIESFIIPDVKAGSWIENDLPAALGLAHASKKPVFVDFSGVT
jgi:thiol:disulfide interchange protein DsbD